MNKKGCVRMSTAFLLLYTLFIPQKKYRHLHLNYRAQTETCCFRIRQEDCRGIL